MSGLLISMALLTFCLLHESVGRTRVTAKPLWKTKLNFKSCFMKCHQDNFCGSFKHKPKTNQCTGYTGSAFSSKAGRHGILFNFCKNRICKGTYGYSWLGSSRMCIRVNFDPENWTTSRKICRKEHADLAVLNSKGKQKSIQRFLDTFEPQLWKKKLKGRRVWIGMRRKGNLYYEWINGKSGYQGWGQGDPSYGDEKCAMLTVKGVADVRCGTTRFFICQLF